MEHDVEGGHLAASRINVAAYAIYLVAILAAQFGSCRKEQSATAACGVVDCVTHSESTAMFFLRLALQCEGWHDIAYA